ncbi:MAG: 2-oxo acid dehydrogenase subunit E2 [Caldilineales bacterium]|nr:2-oxo acid dehydrogenase subunit E2 [Caldilineales bacterium]
MPSNAYAIKPFSPSRRFFVDGMDFGGRKHCIHGLIEVDVTIPRQRIRDIKEQTGESISFTGFIVHCCGRVVQTNKHVQAYRDWRNRLILFNDVDIFVPVERTGGGLFSHAIIRAADRKSVREIHQEIRRTQTRAMPESSGGGFMKWFGRAPRFLRRIFFAMVYGSPHRFKTYMGTVMVTSVGMFGNGAGWGIGPVGHSLVVTVGGIVHRPCVIDGRLESREHLCLTITFDHDVVDGAPAARFLQQFKELIENGKGLCAETE